MNSIDISYLKMNSPLHRILQSIYILVNCSPPNYESKLNAYLAFTCISKFNVAIGFNVAEGF